MSQFDNPLDPIWESYEVATASLSVAQRSLEKSRHELWDKTHYWDKSQRKATPPIRDAIKESNTTLDELIIVALWAMFERTLIEYVQDSATADFTNRPRAFANALKEQLDNEIERWRIESLLGLYRSFINPNLLGKVKQIKDSRDWIVHRNPRKEPTGKVVAPDYTFRTLTSVLEAIACHTST